MANAVEYIINIAGNAEKKLSALEKSFQKVDNAAASAGKKAGILDNLKGSISGLTDSIPALGALASPVGLATAGVIAAGAAIAYATNKAMTFEAGMAKANGTMQKTPAEVANIRNQLLGLAKDAGIDGAVGQIPDAFNLIVSGVGDADLSLQIMKASLKGAEAGFADLNSVSNATVNVLNSVGAANTNANEVMDVLFATLNKGKGEFVDIANYLPKVIPASNSLGISFKETAGAFAFLTANGLGAEQSTTALQNAFKALGTGKIRDNMKGLGVDVFDANGKIRSLTAVSADLNKRLAGLTDEKRTKILESLGFDQEAALAFAKFAQQPEKLKDAIDATVNSAGALQKTLDASTNPMATQRKLWNQVDAVATKLGYAVLPIWNKILEGTLNTINWIVNGVEHLWNNSLIFRGIIESMLLPFKTLWFVAEQAFNFIGSYFTGMYKGLMAVQTGVGNLVDWIYQKLGGEGSLVGLIFGGIEKYYTIFRGVLSNVMEAIDLASKSMNAALSGNFDEAKKYFDLAKAALSKGVPDTAEKAVVKEATSTPDAKKNVFGGTDQKSLAYLNGLKGKEKGQTDKVTGGGSRPVNINITLEALNKGGITVQSATIEQGAAQLEKQFMDMLLRVVNGANQMAIG